MTPQLAATRYGKMAFPKYKFQEYPKKIKFDDGSKLIVNDRAEELRAVAERGNVTQDRNSQETQFVRVVSDLREERQHLERTLSDKDQEILELKSKIAAMHGKVPDIKPYLEGQKNEAPKGNASATGTTQTKGEMNKLVAGETGPEKSKDGDLKQAAPTSGTTFEAFPKSTMKDK